METILVVEDEEHVRELVSVYLRKEGYRVETAEDGEKALAMVRSSVPDLILLANRGFSILNDTIAIFDAVLFEAFSTRHSDGTYAAWEGEDLAWTGAVARWLRRLRRDLPILTLDYADSSCPQLRAFAESRARAYGFIPFVTDYRLEWLPTTQT